jgi:death on curing protein
VTRYITFDEVIAYRHRLMLQNQQAAILLSKEKLEAAIVRPRTEVFGEEAFTTLAEKAAVLLQSIVIGHPFSDGNKRAGAAAMLAFLELNGATMPDDSDELYNFVIAVTTGELREVEDIAVRVRVLFPGS